MINLLSSDVKESVIYARRNRTLIHWMTAMLIGILGIVLVVAGGYFYIDHSVRIYQSDVQSTKDRLSAQKLEETQKSLEDISNSTKLALQVLSKQVLFSRVLQQVGAIMPSGAILQNLTVGKLDGGIDLQIIAKDYQTATQVQVNLQDPSSKIFEKADLVNISCTAGTTTAGAVNPYPCQLNLRVLFAKNNPFLFINQGATP